MNGDQVPQVDRAGDDLVAGAVGRHVAAVIAQPAQGLGRRVAQIVFGASDAGQPARSYRLTPLNQSAEKRADVAAARDRRQHVDMPQQAVRGQRLEQAEAERRAADTAARQRQADGVARQPAGLRHRRGGRHLWIDWGVAAAARVLAAALEAGELGTAQRRRIDAREECGAGAAAASG